MRVLVTGATGFVGAHVVQLLSEAGHEVVGLDSPDTVDSLGASLGVGVERVWADADDLDKVRRAVAHVDAVSHQAFRTGQGDGFADLRSYVRHNDLGTATLLTALHDANFAGHVVAGSSTSVYGDGVYDCADHGRVTPEPRRAEDLDAGRFEPRCSICGADVVAALVTEDAPVRPRGLAAVTRVHQEMLFEAYAIDHPGTTVTTLRYHNLYGPLMPRNSPLVGVAGLFRSQIEDGVRPEVFEDGGQRRDFVHVTDAARANVLAFETAVPFHGVLNIGTGRSATLLEAATTLCVAHDSRLWPAVVGRYRPGASRHLLASSTRAHDVLGFRARIGLHEGMSSFATAPMSAPEAHQLIGA